MHMAPEDSITSVGDFFSRASRQAQLAFYSTMTLAGLGIWVSLGGLKQLWWWPLG